MTAQHLGDTEPPPPDEHAAELRAAYERGKREGREEGAGISVAWKRYAIAWKGGGIGVAARRVAAREALLALGIDPSGGL